MQLRDERAVHAREHGFADAVVVHRDRAFLGRAHAAHEFGAPQLGQRRRQVQLAFGQARHDPLAQRPARNREQLEHGRGFAREPVEPLGQRALEADLGAAAFVREADLAAHVIDELSDQIRAAA